MTFQSASPVYFGTKSLVTTSLGYKDPEVGAFHTDTDGLTYRFIYNDGGASVPVGCGVVTNNGATNFYSVTVSSVSSADLLVGVCRHATITTGAYAWVVVHGVTSVQMAGTSGTVSTGGLIEVSANGYFVPVSNTTGNKAPCVGKAMNTIASSGTDNAYIRCFGA